MPHVPRAFFGLVALRSHHARGRALPVCNARPPAAREGADRALDTMRRAWLFVMPVGKLKRASAPGPSGEDGQEPRGREHADVVRRGRTGAPSAQSRGWMPRADQAGAVGQHEEAVGQAQAGGGDGGHDGIQGAGGARAWLPAVRSSPVFVNCWPWDVCQVARRILGVISMDYPDEVDGVALHKSGL